MKLIPEQIYLLEQEIKEAQRNRKILQEQIDKTAAHTTGDGESNDSNTEEKEAIQRCNNEIAEYSHVLSTADRVMTIPVDKIGLGTKFLLQFAGEEAEEYTLVATKVGCIGKLAYISTESPLGKILPGKKAGEEFSYDIPVGTTNKRTISGSVVDIITDRNEYINYITSRKIDDRKASALKRTKAGKQPELLPLTQSQYELLAEKSKDLLVKIEREQLKATKILPGSRVTITYKGQEPHVYTIVDKKEIEIDPKTEISWESRLADKVSHGKIGEEFTYSTKIQPGRRKSLHGVIEAVDNEQVYPAEEVKHNLYSLRRQLGYVNQTLKRSVLANIPKDGTIGIGSQVSIMSFTKEGIKNRRVEVIQQAVSYELEPNYEEAISSLGSQILGLKDNEEFTYIENGKPISGMVYDIDNNKNASNQLSPLAHQKSKGKR